MTGRWRTCGSTTLLVLAKEPRPGRVKTRLQKRFTPEQAAGLAAESLADTLAAVLKADVDRRVLALDGSVGDWTPAGLEVIGQSDGGLDQRLAGAFAQVFATATGPGRVLLVGMDTPQLTADLLTRDWDGADAAIGLSTDGGFWAVGLNRSVEGVFEGIPMSTEFTGKAQLARLRSLGLRVYLLPELRDVDTPEDAVAVAASAPHTRFARRHRKLTTIERHPLELYAAALDGRPIQVETADGQSRPIDVERWVGPPDEIDRMMLNRCEGTVLDVGCGPGRLVGALAETGVAALGVDVSMRAVQLTADRGACVLRRPIEGPLPAEGRWGTVLLADGNLGIGGDPDALLRRCRRLLHPTGLLLVEADPDDDRDDTGPIVLVDAIGSRTRPLPWARLGSAALARLAGRTGFRVVEEWRAADRVFLALRAVTSESVDLVGGRPEAG
jgi:rSAM/selenodomain-associated transferase 1